MAPGVRRLLALCVAATVVGWLWVPLAMSAPAVRLSIVTGGTGGVYFPMGGGLAQLISKFIPGVQATAEVTSASVDNMRLIGAKRADVAFTLADTAFDAFKAGGVQRRPGPHPDPHPALQQLQPPGDH